MLITLTGMTTTPPTLSRHENTIKIDFGHLLIELGTLDFLYLINLLTAQAGELGLIKNKYT
jgi:hypothetical protein